MSVHAVAGYETGVATDLAPLAAALLALLHLIGARLRFLDVLPRSRWLSAAAGVSVAYVFVHLLPELAEGQERLREEAEGLLPFLEDHVYLLALAGLTLFYAVERVSKASRAERPDHEGTGPGAFWLSTVAFAVYNAMIGYLLVHGETDSIRSLALYTAAIGVHFVINDFSLREHHRDAYQHRARWLLAGAILVGYVLGELTEISEEAVAALIAFIGGGVILNVLKEELPDERRARVGPFLLGAASYAALLQAI